MELTCDSFQVTQSRAEAVTSQGASAAMHDGRLRSMSAKRCGASSTRPATRDSEQRQRGECVTSVVVGKGPERRNVDRAFRRSACSRCKTAAEGRRAAAANTDASPARPRDRRSRWQHSAPTGAETHCREIVERSRSPIVIARIRRHVLRQRPPVDAHGRIRSIVEFERIGIDPPIVAEPVERGRAPRRRRRAGRRRTCAFVRQSRNRGQRTG